MQSPWLYIYLFSLQKNKNKKRYFYNKIWLISFFYNRIPVFGYVKEFHVLLLVLLGMFFCGGTLTFGLIYSVFKMAVNFVADFFKKILFVWPGNVSHLADLQEQDEVFISYRPCGSARNDSACMPYSGACAYFY